MLFARLTLTSLALAAAFATSAARAADYSQPPPPVVYQPPPQVDVIASSWYLRGDIGVGMHRNKLDYLPSPGNAGLGVRIDQNSSGDTTFIGGGVGYEFNNWLRFDATAEYRAKTRLYSVLSYPAGFNYLGSIDAYEGQLSSWVFLANAYVDLGTWNCFTPFVGVGIGGARNTLSAYTDINPNGGYGYGRNPSEWHFAYALHAGIAYNVSKTFKVELAYRYLNYGSITDTVDCASGCGGGPDSFKYGNLSSHDIKLGFRWLCCDVEERTRYVYQPQPYTPPPVYLQPPPPVYQPPPPLRSKG